MAKGTKRKSPLMGATTTCPGPATRTVPFAAGGATSVPLTSPLTPLGEPMIDSARGGQLDSTFDQRGEGLTAVGRLASLDARIVGRSHVAGSVLSLLDLVCRRGRRSDVLDLARLVRHLHGGHLVCHRGRRRLVCHRGGRLVRSSGRGRISIAVRLRSSVRFRVVLTSPVRSVIVILR